MEWPDLHQTMLFLCITLLGGLSYSAIVMATRWRCRCYRTISVCTVGFRDADRNFLLGNARYHDISRGRFDHLSGLYTFWREKVTENQPERDRYSPILFVSIFRP